MQKSFEKHHIFSALLKKGSVFVHLNPRTDANVPMRLRLQDQVILQFGLDMPVPIPDMNWDEHSVMGTLSFKGVPYFCEVPWTNVFALVGEDSKGMVFQEDMPQSIRNEAERNRRNAEIAKEVPTPLKLVSSKPLKELTAVRSITKEKVFKKDRPSHLRLVK